MSSLIDQIFKLKQEYQEMKDVIDLKGPESQELDFQPLFYPGLIRIRRDLSCLSLDFAKSTAVHLRDFKTKKAQRETQRYLKQKEFMSQGVKVTQAEAQARQATADMLEPEAVAEGFYMTGRLIINQVNEVLKSLNQDISILKKEYESLNQIT